MGTIESSETVDFASALRAQRTTTAADVDRNDAANGGSHTAQQRWTARQAHRAVCGAAH